MILLLEKIESDDLENKCSPDELEKIKHFVVFLAKQGSLRDGSDESLSLDDDIEELLTDEADLLENIFSFETINDYWYTIVSAVMNGYGEVFLCKSWIKSDIRRNARTSRLRDSAAMVGSSDSPIDSRVDGTI